MPLSSEQRKKVVDEVNRIIKQGVTLGDKSAEAFAKDITKIRDEIAAKISKTEGLTASHLKKIKDDVDDILKELADKGKKAVLDAEKQSYGMGETLATSVLKTAGITKALPGVSKDQLIALQNMSADLVTGITDEIAGKIKNALNQAMLGGLTPREASLKVDSILGDLQDRGEAIVRTEVGSAFSLASQLRYDQYSKALPGLQKQWMANLDGRERPSHADAHKQVKDIDEPFDLKNDRTGEIEYPMFPGDPVLSPENRINCRCVQIPFMKEWGAEVI